MPVDTRTRTDAVAWRKDAIARLRQALSLAKAFRTNLDKVCDGIRATTDEISRLGEQIADRYDRELADDDEEYERDSEAMEAMKYFPLIDDEAEDAKLQAGESLDALIERLSEILDAAKEAKP